LYLIRLFTIFLITISTFLSRNQETKLQEQSRYVQVAIGFWHCQCILVQAV
jgi:hypothetical protein